MSASSAYAWVLTSLISALAINLACVDVTHHVSESDTEVAPVGVLLMSTHDCVPVLLMLGYQLI